MAVSTKRVMYVHCIDSTGLGVFCEYYQCQNISISLHDIGYSITLLFVFTSSLILID